MTEEFLDEMEQNPLVLSSFFEPYIQSDRVATQLGPLSDLRELISADSVGGFVLAYSAILSGSVDVQPSLGEKLASTKQNIGNKDSYEIR
jgi:hypothetical protein